MIIIKYPITYLFDIELSIAHSIFIIAHSTFIIERSILSIGYLLFILHYSLSTPYLLPNR